MSHKEDILKKILRQKHLEVTALEAKSRLNRFEKLFSSPNKQFRIIAEVKMHSPRGETFFTGDVKKLVKQYEFGSADALSVVTDKEFFGGSSSLFRKVRASSRLPLLKKDFVIAPTQLLEARDLGADAVLLIARIVERKNLTQLVKLANHLGMVPIVEIFRKVEIKAALQSGANFIGVNSRNLATQKINMANALRIIRMLPENKHKLLFSGVKSADDVLAAQKAGAEAVLIGASLLKAANPSQMLQMCRSRL